MHVLIFGRRHSHSSCLPQLTVRQKRHLRHLIGQFSRYQVQLGQRILNHRHNFILH